MATFRNVVLANDQIYHVFNRGVERRTVFGTQWEFKRALDVFKFYRFSNLPFRFSQLLKLPKEERERIISEINTNAKLVEIISFCLMPNHFHFILKQLQSGGIKKFISNFSNSYSKYFNTKHERIGPLFEGIFKAVLVESDEQLIHLSRYIHLNPVSSFLIPNEKLENYIWSSLPEYLENIDDGICSKDTVLSLFPSIESYHKFILNQISYAQELDKIKHLIME
ncbi:hypothetical protein C4559_04435 [Candidatus Microgenomates bacterium]|nr:MAG: hypothetical protein C4559_04435 [Candidatus Microgenomates bacterium]